VSGATPLSVNQQYNYDAYGVGLALPQSPLTSYLYTGQQFDSVLKQYYLRARYYDPSNGRFNQVDPFAGKTFDPQSLHKYDYCHDDPVNRVDPSGQFSLIELLVVVAIALAIADTSMYLYARSLTKPVTIYLPFALIAQGGNLLKGNAVEIDKMENHITEALNLKGYFRVVIQYYVGPPGEPPPSSLRWEFYVTFGQLPVNTLDPYATAARIITIDDAKIADLGPNVANSGYTWSNVILHEMGHEMLLTHSTDPRNVMYVPIGSGASWLAEKHYYAPVP
jgi:RHS repeat-associated protein